MKEKLTSRDLQAQATKEKLMRTSMELIAREGYRNVTVSRICRECGVAIGTFYQYFNAKKDIIALLVREHNEQLGRTVETEFSGSARRVYLRYVDTYMARIEAMGVTLSRSLMQGLLEEDMDWDETGDQFQRDFFRRLVDYGRERGEFPAGCMAGEDFFRIFLSTVNGLLMEWLAENGAMNLKDSGRRYLGPLVRLLELPGE